MEHSSKLSNGLIVDMKGHPLIKGAGKLVERYNGAWIVNMFQLPDDELHYYMISPEFLFSRNEYFEIE